MVRLVDYNSNDAIFEVLYGNKMLRKSFLAPCLPHGLCQASQPQLQASHRKKFGCSLLLEVDLSQSGEDSEAAGSDVSVWGLLNEIWGIFCVPWGGKQTWLVLTFYQTYLFAAFGWIWLLSVKKASALKISAESRHYAMFVLYLTTGSRLVTNSPLRVNLPMTTGLKPEFLNLIILQIHNSSISKKKHDFC